jgi:hypothetical protein
MGYLFVVPGGVASSSVPSGPYCYGVVLMTYLATAKRFWWVVPTDPATATLPFASVATA